MSKRSVVPACWLGASLLAVGVHAAAPPPDSPLEELVQEALRNNPDLRAAEEAALAAKERPAQVALPDPRVVLGYTNEGWQLSLGAMPDSNLAVMASQDLPFPGKLRLRSDISRVEADRSQLQVARARLSIAAAVRRAYYGLVLAEAQLTLVREQGEIWRHVEAVARARYAAGQGTQQDVLRTQVEVTRNEQFILARRAEGAVRTAEIQRLLGRAGGEPLTVPAHLADVAETPDLDRAIQAALQVSPELAAARLDTQRARLAVDLARREYKPDFVVQGAYMNRGGFDPMWQASVGLNLPLRRNRRAAAVAEAEAAARAAEARVQSVELVLTQRTRERIAELDAARRTAALYAGGIVRQGESSVEAAQASYQTGRVPFVTVLEALNSLYADRARLLDLREAQARLRVDLDEASLERGGAAMAPGAPAAAPQPAAADAPAMGSMSR